MISVNREVEHIIGRTMGWLYCFHIIFLRETVQNVMPLYWKVRTRSYGAGELRRLSYWRRFLVPSCRLISLRSGWSVSQYCRFSWALHEHLVVEAVQWTLFFLSSESKPQSGQCYFRSSSWSKLFWSCEVWLRASTWLCYEVFQDWSDCSSIIWWLPCSDQIVLASYDASFVSIRIDIVKPECRMDPCPCNLLIT